LSASKKVGDRSGVGSWLLHQEKKKRRVTEVVWEVGRHRARSYVSPLPCQLPKRRVTEVVWEVGRCTKKRRVMEVVWEVGRCTKKRRLTKVVWEVGCCTKKRRVTEVVWEVGRHRARSYVSPLPCQLLAGGAILPQSNNWDLVLSQGSLSFASFLAGSGNMLFGI